MSYNTHKYKILLAGQHLEEYNKDTYDSFDWHSDFDQFLHYKYLN